MAKDFTLSPDRVIASTVYLEACENYQKQTYRNRCRIYAQDGVQTLSVPVVHEGGTYELPITSVRVDYSTPWLLQSERAIISAYETSAFFDYYKDELFTVLDSHPETLWELNLRIIRFFLDKTGIAVDLRFTEDFNPVILENDFRSLIHPKRHNDILSRLGLEKPYFQVFARKYGFIPNLSVMDLLFNEGPDSINYLKRL